MKRNPNLDPANFRKAHVIGLRFLALFKNVVRYKSSSRTPSSLIFTELTTHHQKTLGSKPGIGFSRTGAATKYALQVGVGNVPKP